MNHWQTLTWENFELMKPRFNTCLLIALGKTIIGKESNLQPFHYTLSSLSQSYNYKRISLQQFLKDFKRYH